MGSVSAPAAANWAVASTLTFVFDGAGFVCGLTAGPIDFKNDAISALCGPMPMLEPTPDRELPLGANGSSAATTSSIDWKRSSGDFAIILWKACSSDHGTSSRAFTNDGGGSLRCDINREIIVSPS